MTVKQLRKWLKQYPPDDEVQIGVFYGPGCPDVEPYEITEVRKPFGSVLVLCEVPKVPKCYQEGWTPPGQAHRSEGWMKMGR